MMSLTEPSYPYHTTLGWEFCFGDYVLLVPAIELLGECIVLSLIEACQCKPDVEYLKNRVVIHLSLRTQRPLHSESSRYLSQRQSYSLLPKLHGIALEPHR
jgi:hypothetical protein